MYAASGATDRLRATGIGTEGKVYDLTYAADYASEKGLVTFDGAGGLRAVNDGEDTVSISVVSGDVIHRVILPVRCEQGNVTVAGFEIDGFEILSDSDTITEDGGTMQLIPSFRPVTAATAGVVWSIVGEDGQPTLLASITEYGLLRAHGNGKVTVKAALRDDPTIFCEKAFTLTGQSQRLYEEVGFDPDKWTAGDDSWSLTEGVLTRETSRIKEQAYNFTFHRDTACVTARADFLFADSRNGGYIGFHFRFDDQTSEADRNGFVAGVAPDGHVFVLIPGGDEMDAEPVFIPNFDRKTPFNLAVSMVEDHVTVYVNGEKMLEYQSRGLASSIGAVSLGSEGRAMEVTNFSMQYLSESVYTVSFESNGGSATDAQTVKEGETAETPATPTREGYLFAGWYLDEACTVAYDFATPAESNLLLYAKWIAEPVADDTPSDAPADTDEVPSDTEDTPTTDNDAPPSTEKTYTVTFDARGGSAVADQTVKEGGAVSKPADPTRDGYVFDGWYRDEACTQVYDFSATVEGDLTLYAKWSEASDEVGGCGGCQSTLSAWPAMLALVAVGGVIARKRHED